MAVYRPTKDSKVWWYDFIFEGQRVRESAKTRSKTLAKEAEHARHRELEEIRRGRSTAVVDVATVGRAADGDNLRAEVGQHTRTDFVGRAVCTVDHNLHTRQIDAGFDRGGTEFLVERA